MVLASQLRAGMAIRFENQLYRVAAADYHPGQGKMGGVLHARLRNLETGTTWEHSLRADLKIEELSLERVPMDFLYRDGELCYFMNPDTFEQVAVPASMMGEQATLLQPEMRLSVEMLDGSPVGLNFPDFLEVAVEDTAPPSHQQQDSTWKTARLANSLEIQVPQFIKTGDVIRMDVTGRKYMDRVKVPGKGT